MSSKPNGSEQLPACHSETVISAEQGNRVASHHPSPIAHHQDDIAIRVQNLSKCYQLYDRPEDRLKQAIYPRLRRLIGMEPKSYAREFWALRDVSFEVKKGETVGIIGRNGSGKSTLLQMICGTLNPTNGTIETQGRIAALLELGSGFNPEFTGRENVYMNGAILGLDKEEIDARFDDIAAFADIGQFIDHPVKTYSSGMYVRLAFAVIVHLDADVLVIDEALAVGDAFFVQKCMIRIKKLIGDGTTVLFVSHDSNAVKSLCERALLLDCGELKCSGDTHIVVEYYYQGTVQEQQDIISIFIDNAVPLTDENNDELQRSGDFCRRAQYQRLQNGKAEFVNVRLLNESGDDVRQASFGQLVMLRMVVRVHLSLPVIGAAYHIRDKNGFDLVYSDTSIENCPITNAEAGNLYLIDWQFRTMLRDGDYTIATMLSIPLDLSIGQVEVCDFVPIAVQIKVGRGSQLPIYGSVYWTNKVTCRLIQAKPLTPGSKP